MSGSIKKYLGGQQKRGKGGKMKNRLKLGNRKVIFIQ